MTRYRVSHDLRRCINPDCRILFHPPRECSVYCRACATDAKVRRLASLPKGDADARSQAL